MAKFENITQPDMHGYQVRIVREGTEHSRYFSKRVWGGEEKALEAAISWRDTKKASLPKRFPFINEAPKNNSTGVNGISKVIHHDKRRGTKTLRYQVSYRTADGRQSVRTFQVGRIEYLTPEDDLHAFRTAMLFRKEYELARSMNLFFDTKRFRDWKHQQLYS